MAKSHGGAGSNPEQNPNTTGSMEGLSQAENEALNNVVRQEGDYKQLQRIFESLRSPKGRKEAGFGSQAEYVQSLKEAIQQWGTGPKKDAAELFIADFESQAQGAQGGGKGKKAGRKQRNESELPVEEVIVEEAEEKGRKKRGPREVRNPLADEIASVAKDQAARERMSAAEKKVEVVEETSKAVEIIGPSAEAPTVEIVKKVVEDAEEQAKETGEPITLEQYRKMLMEWFPRLSVRYGFRDTPGVHVSNLDGNACLFMFRDVMGFAEGTEEEKKYVFDNVVYVKPGTYQKGALNLDTSPGMHGIKFADETLFVDHHGSESERHSSAFQLLYEDFKRVGLDKQLTPENKTTLERLSQFVTHVDSYTLPPGVRWDAAWEDSHRTVFGLTLAYQNEVSIRDLFEFFKHHDLKEAWTFSVYESEEPYLEKLRELALRWWEQKPNTERFVREVKRYPNEMGFVAETKELGKIFVQTQRSHREKKEALQFAALAEGFDGVLVWEPGSKSFFLAVGEKKEVTPKLLEKIGEGILVRKSMVLQRGKERMNTLGSLLLTLGVNKNKLPSEVKKQVEEAAGVPAGDNFKKENPPLERGEKTLAEQQADFRNFLTETLLREKGILPEILFKSTDWLHRLVKNWDIFLQAITNYEATSKEQSSAQKEAEDLLQLILKMHPDLAQEEDFKNWLEKLNKPVAEKPLKTPEMEQPPQILETRGGKFNPGELVVPKGSHDEIPKRVEGYIIISGSKYYKVEGIEGRRYREESLEKFVKPEEEREIPKEETNIPPETETPPELYDTARLRELGEGGEDPETVRVRMDEKRQAYIDLYKEYLTAKEGSGRWDKLKKKFWPFGRKKEGAPIVLPEVILDLKTRLETARDYYLEAKKEYARALFQAKARELAEAGLTVEEIADELNKFGHEIFNKLLIGEEAALQAAEAAEWPAKEKNILRKGFDWWTKQHWTVRALMTTGILTGALFAGGYIGVGAVGSYAGWRLARSGAGAILGQFAGKALELVMGRRIVKFVDANLQDAMIEFREAGGDPRDVIDSIWQKQNRIFEEKKKKEKHKLYAKIGAMVAAGVGASYGLSMFLSGSTEVAEQAVAAHGGVGAGEPSLEELQKKVQDIMEEADKQHRGFMEALRQKAEIMAEQARLDEISTVNKGEGVISVFRRQLEEMPAKFGYTGNLKDVAAIHEWANHEAAQLSIKAGYWNPATGDQNWVKWNPKSPMHFYVEGDAQHGFRVAETGTEGKHFIHHPSEAEQMRLNEARAKLPWREFDEQWDKENAARVAAAAHPAGPSIAPRGVEEAAFTPRTALSRVPVELTPKAGGEFPSEVQPYANYLEAKLRAAQNLVNQYGDDPKLGPSVWATFEHTEDDIENFVNNVADKHLDVYKNFSPKGLNVVNEVREAVEKQTGIKLPSAEVIPSSKGLSIAELIKGGRIDIDKTWGLKFESGVGGRVVPVIDAPRADMSKIFESHAGMKTDGWIDQDKIAALSERNSNLGAVPQTRLAQIDFLVRALDKIKVIGQGSTEAAKIVKETIRGMMNNISETIDTPVDEVFTKQFLDRIK